MKEIIIKKLEEIEKEKGVTILFAVESGSRSWRMSSKDSDYDVRFVYYRPVEDYITLNSKPDVIKATYDKEGVTCPEQGCYIDVLGFDIIKYARMVYSSNPTVIEWIQSDITYMGEKPQEFVDFATKYFKQISLYYHYKSMCKQNYIKYLKSGSNVTYKKYLYAMRGLINAKWVSMCKSLPPINFPDTIDLLIKEHFMLTDGEKESFKIPPLIVLRNLKQIINLKKEQKEKDIIQNQVKLDNYIEECLKDDSDAPTTKQLATTLDLDNVIKRVILK